MNEANGSSLAVIEANSSMEANVGVLMRRATDVAGVCREIVTKTAQSISGRKYVRVEGWQSIAVAFGCVAGSRDVEKVAGGIRAIGEVRRMSDGAVISTAEGFVGDDEKTWAARPEYARRAMAQTRAVSRACRGAFSFVVTLIDSDLSTTPAEEMDFDKGSETPPPPKSAPTGTAALKEALRPKPIDGEFRETPPHDPKTGEVRPPPAGKPSWNRQATFAFGKDKGVAVADLSEGSLKWYSDCFKRDLADASKARFHDATRGQLETVQAELASRGVA